MTHEPVNLTFLDPLFTGPIVHLTGGPGVGKSLLLLYYLGHRALAHHARILWIDAGGSLPSNRVKTLFGQATPQVLSHMLVAKAGSLPHLKAIASELVSHGSPPSTTHLVVDPISRLPRFALTSTANSAGQGQFVAEDFFTSVIEPLITVAARDGFQLVFVHEDSQNHPFWWDRYPAREHRVYLKKYAFNSPQREIYNESDQRAAILDLSCNPIRVNPI